MELIRIDDEKLKMILTHEDLAKFEIDESELDYANSETRRMFRELLRRAKHEIGFDTDGHRVLVQLYPTRSGGCELFVTRLGLLSYDCDFETDGEDDAMNLHQNAKASSEQGCPRVFGFETLDALLCVCRRLSALGYRETSDVFREAHGRYYLFLKTPYAPEPYSVDEFSFLYEYGTAERVDQLLARLYEYGTPVCLGTATERLGSL